MVVQDLPLDPFGLFSELFDADLGDVELVDGVFGGLVELLDHSGDAQSLWFVLASVLVTVFLGSHGVDDQEKHVSVLDPDFVQLFVVMQKVAFEVHLNALHGNVCLNSEGWYLSFGKGLYVFDELVRLDFDRCEDQVAVCES